MSVEVKRVDVPAKRLEIARFTPETLTIATSNNDTFVCGWKKPYRIACNTHILIEANFGEGYKVVGDGWAMTSMSDDDDRFGDAFPYTVQLDGVRVIVDPENFIDSPVSWPAQAISIDHEGQTFINASRVAVELDYLWAEGLTDEPSVIESWDI